MTAPGNSRLEQRLAHERRSELARRLDRSCPAIGERSRLHYRIGERPVTSLCSNDYLGFADELGPASTSVAGSGASRLVCGDLDEHRAIEQAFAEFLELPDAVLFPSGFQANVGVPACLLRADDLVASDELNHASLIDGLRLAAAPRRVVAHNQRPRLDATIRGLQWWFTESVFSMDGDGPAAADLDAHLDAGGCLYLDEAHAIGLGPGGRGRAAALRNAPTLLVAPLGKAFGCAGAIVAGSREVCSHVRTHARSFVFTTGVSPALLPRLAHALALVSGSLGEARRARLHENVAILRDALALPEVELLAPISSPIIPIIVGSNHDALALSHALLERGWHVQAIRPPTVPEQGARLRITVSARHEGDELRRFAADFHACLADVLERASEAAPRMGDVA